MNKPAKPLTSIVEVPDSSIIDIVRYGRQVEGTIPLWLGEGDRSTPEFISEVAINSLRDGATFYTPNRGIPELRDALVRYYRNIFGIKVSERRVSATNSGMHAVTMIAMSLLTKGDNAVLLTPCWPNIDKAIQFLGAQTREVETPLVNGVFQLDVQKVIDICDADTKLIYLASPGNPTGWTIPESDARALLKFSRESGIAIISDEVYQRLSFHSDPGFSFLNIADPEDSLFVVNSFSKSWSMTGWRLGWMVFPDCFHDTFEKLSQFSISGSPGFLQHGAVAALDHGKDYVAELRQQAMNSSQFIEKELSQLNGVTVIPSMGGIYSMFQVEQFPDDLDFCKRAIDVAGVGFAPGSAFGKGGENLVRLCHLRSLDVLERAVNQLKTLL